MKAQKWTDLILVMKWTILWRTLPSTKKSNSNCQSQTTSQIKMSSNRDLKSATYSKSITKILNLLLLKTPQSRLTLLLNIRTLMVIVIVPLAMFSFKKSRSRICLANHREWWLPLWAFLLAMRLLWINLRRWKILDKSTILRFTLRESSFTSLTWRKMRLLSFKSKELSNLIL